MNQEIAGQVAMPPKILRLTATTGARIAEVEPSAGQQQPAEPGIVWVVRAEGRFTTNRYPPGAKPSVATSGFYVVSDSDGLVLSFGFP